MKRGCKTCLFRCSVLEDCLSDDGTVFKDTFWVCDLHDFYIPKTGFCHAYEKED